MSRKIDRRLLLKSAGATAALAGFGLSAPAVHSANEKVVRYLGTATTMGSEIDKKLFDDTGIRVKYIRSTPMVTKRVLTQPNSLTLLTQNTLVTKIGSIGQHFGHGF